MLFLHGDYIIGPYLETEHIMRYLYLTFFMILLWGITSCSSSKNVPYMVDIEDIPAEVLNAATVQSSPVLAPGDIRDISVVAKNQEVVIPFNKRLMQGEAYLRGNASKAVEYYLIDQAGNIDFPVIGRIHVAGKSKMEVEDLIQELLYPEYLNDSVDTKLFYIGIRRCE